MKFLLLCLTLVSSQAFAGANCAHSQSWQCAQHSSSTSSSSPQQPVPDHQTSNPATGTTNQPLGSITPGHHNVTLTDTPAPKPAGHKAKLPPSVPKSGPTVVAPQPMANQQAPQLITPPPMQVPPPKTPTMLTAPQPMANQQTPQLITPPPMQVPPPKTPQFSTQNVGHKQKNPTNQKPVAPLMPNITAQQRPTQQYLVQHSSTPAVPLSAPGYRDAQYGLEMIEPGVENHRVEVYRSHDALEQVYKDTIPMDEGDFNLIVIGIRTPDYMHSQP
jgi:hypothetical protein